MPDVVLSGAVRNNLLSLQGTADLLAKTQERLATGLRVNSALDDPTAFFTAASLNSRAGDLNRLLDSVGLAIQTLEAADNAISAITDLVENAQATARQALQASKGTFGAAATAQSNVLAADVAAEATSTGTITGATTLSSLGFTTADSITITVGGASYEIGFDNGGTATQGTEDEALDLATATVDNLISAFNAGLGAAATVDDGTGDQFQVTAAATNEDIVISSNSATIISGLNLDSVGSGTTTSRTIEPTNATLGSLSGTLTFAVGNGATKTITFGTDDSSSEVNNRTELAAVLSGLEGGTLQINANRLEVTATSNSESITIGGTASVLTALGFTAGLVNPTVSTASTERSTLQSEFNALRTQIDQLAADAKFNGINLLQSDNLQVIFNEDSTSSLTISGVDFDASGLSISQATGDAFQNDAQINATLAELDTAISALRSQAATFGSNLSVVETRQDFTKNLINTLETGAANLTLADTNEEGANLLALQTRQQLSSVALSLASQSDQNVLRLF